VTSSDALQAYLLDLVRKVGGVSYALRDSGGRHLAPRRRRCRCPGGHSRPRKSALGHLRHARGPAAGRRRRSSDRAFPAPRL